MLKRKMSEYDDVSLAHIFALNNNNYIAKALDVSSSPHPLILLTTDSADGVTAMMLMFEKFRSNLKAIQILTYSNFW